MHRIIIHHQPTLFKTPFYYTTLFLSFTACGLHQPAQQQPPQLTCKLSPCSPSSSSSTLPFGHQPLSSFRNMSSSSIPGGTPETKSTMTRLLVKNHDDFDINYFEYFANHLPHAIASLYDLGASSQRLESYYDWYSGRLKSLRKPNFTVNDDNWKEYIGNQEVYSELLVYFDKQVKTLGIEECIQKYIPELIPGFIGAALHPLIHIGYGIEYNLPVVFAEGLAYACTGYHKRGVIINDLSKANQAQNSASVLELVKQLQALDIDEEELREGRFSQKLEIILTKYEPQVKELLAKWSFSKQPSPEEIESKLTELSHATVLVFFGSYRERSLGFFLAHCLTGNHAVRVLLPRLSPPQQVKLLQANLLALLGVYVAEGRPSFSEDVIYNVTAPGSADGVGGAKTKGNNKEINWSDIINETVECEDEHMVKVIRSLLVIKDSVPDDKIPHKLLAHSGFMMASTIKKEKEWIFDGIGFHTATTQ